MSLLMDIDHQCLSTLASEETQCWELSQIVEEGLYTAKRIVMDGRVLERRGRAGLKSQTRCVSLDEKEELRELIAAGHWRRYG